MSTATVNAPKATGIKDNFGVFKHHNHNKKWKSIDVWNNLSHNTQKISLVTNDKKLKHAIKQK